MLRCERATLTAVALLARLHSVHSLNLPVCFLFLFFGVRKRVVAFFSIVVVVVSLALSLRACGRVKSDATYQITDNTPCNLYEYVARESLLSVIFFLSFFFLSINRGSEQLANIFDKNHLLISFKQSFSL